MNAISPLLAAAQPGHSTLTSLDWLAIAGYFAILLCVAWWVVRKSKNEAADYFLAGRNLGWWVIGASIFASNIGSEHLVGLAASGATDGVAMAHYELHAWCLLVLGWVMVPFYMRSKVFTMPEFLERRFSPMARTVLSVISLVAYILTKIAVGIFAGGVVFAVLLVVTNTMAMSIRERTTEIAVLRALGFRTNRLLVMLTAEAAMIAASGTAVGCVLAAIACQYVQRYRIGGAMEMNLQMGLPTVSLTLAVALAISLASTLVPAYKTTRANIARALRYVG